MKIDVKGLRFQNWLYLMAFSVLILAVLWALQFLFLRSFYQSMKLHETKSIGDKITANYGSADFLPVLNEYAFQNNLRIVLLEPSGRLVGSFDGFHTDELVLFSPGSILLFPQNDLATLKDKLAESKSDRACYLNRSGESDTAVYVALLSDQSGVPYILYISSPIPAIDSTISVLKTQFIIITVILFILALAAAQWISQKMSKPIIGLTKAAERLVKGELELETESAAGELTAEKLTEGELTAGQPAAEKPVADSYQDSFTEIRQLAAALNYAASELRSLDRYRREFIANVSHDLKTPLTIIRFYSEMIKDVSGDKPAKRAEHCDTIIKETDWLSGMVEEILELAKLESGFAEITQAAVNLSRCLQDTLESFQVLADREGYVFSVDIEEDVMVIGNEMMLRRVLYNLISNAINFTGENKLVHISLMTINDHGHLEVTDSGEGIPEDKLHAIWERYYKSGEPHKRAVVGSGLGLSIVKNVLMLHNAAYGVVSEPGQGSTFWFELAKVSG